MLSVLLLWRETMKVSELIKLLKTMPQDLDVYGPSEDSEYDYTPIRKEAVTVVDLELVDEDNDDYKTVRICVIGDWLA
jgi:hypothetical protein